MKLGRLLIAWALLTVAAFAATERYAFGKIDPQDASALLKASAALFAAASASLGIVFRALDAPPPKELDDVRQERWTRKFNNRFEMLWVRWSILVLVTGLSILAGATLDGKFSLIDTRTAFAIGGSCLVVGLFAMLMSIHEWIALRRLSQKMAATLQERKKLQEFLNPPESSAETGGKTARA